jgi:hypothetical protein
VWYLSLIIVASMLLGGVWVRWMPLEQLSTAWLGLVALFMVGVPWLRRRYSAESLVTMSPLAWLLMAGSERGWASYTSSSTVQVGQ